jgi:hypothetical protein
VSRVEHRDRAIFFVACAEKDRLNVFLTSKIHIALLNIGRNAANLASATVSTVENEEMAMAGTVKYGGSTLDHATVVKWACNRVLSCR